MTRSTTLKKPVTNALGQFRACIATGLNTDTYIWISDEHARDGNRLFYNGEWWKHAGTAKDGTPRFERE